MKKIELPTLSHDPGCICRQCCKVGEHAPARSASPEPVAVHSDSFRSQPEACRYICGLVSSFICLRTLVPEKWDIDNFMQSLGTASSGERMAMLFIANVWNPAYAKDNDWIFDVFEALQRWDSRGQYAFSEWVQNPRFP